MSKIKIEELKIGQKVWYDGKEEQIWHIDGLDYKVRDLAYGNAVPKWRNIYDPLFSLSPPKSEAELFLDKWGGKKIFSCEWSETQYFIPEKIDGIMAIGTSFYKDGKYKENDSWIWKRDWKEYKEPETWWIHEYWASGLDNEFMYCKAKTQKDWDSFKNNRLEHIKSERVEG